MIINIPKTRRPAYDAKQEPRFKQFWRAMVKDLQSVYAPKELQAAYIEGNLTQEQLSRIGEVINQHVTLKLRPLLSSATYDSGSSMANIISRSTKKGLMAMFSRQQKDFDTSNQALRNFVDLESSYYIVDVTAEQKANVTRLLQKSIDTNQGGKWFADQIKSIIGLTELESKWALKFYSDVFADLTANGMSVSKASEAAAKKYVRYTADLQEMRSIRIARTEAGRTYMVGNQEAIRQAGEAGITDSNDTWKIWRGALDDRERLEHLAMEGERRHLGATYSNGEMYPGEHSINCRCYEQYDVGAA